MATPVPGSPLADSPPDRSPAQERASWWEDFIDIFYEPSAVFARRRDASFWIPLIVFAVISLAIVLVGRAVLEPIFDAEFTRGVHKAMQDNPAITAEQMDKMRAVQMKLLPLFAALGAFILPLATGVVLWLAAMAVDARVRIGQACTIAALAFIPRLLGGVLGVAQGYFMDPASLDGQFRIALSPARFLDPDTTSPIVMALLGRVDLFALWTMLLLAIGVAVVARVPRTRGAAAAAIVYVVSSLPAILQGIRAS